MLDMDVAPAAKGEEGESQECGAAVGVLLEPEATDDNGENGAEDDCGNAGVGYLINSRGRTPPMVHAEQEDVAVELGVDVLNHALRLRVEEREKGSKNQSSENHGCVAEK